MISRHRDLIVSVAARFDLDARLLEAQVWQESSDIPTLLHYDDNFYRAYIKGNPAAAAAKWDLLAACSLGLLQIEWEVAVERGFTGPPGALLLPSVGLPVAAGYLAHLVTLAHGDVLSALRAYNAGPAALHHPDEDTAYVQRVLQREAELT